MNDETQTTPFPPDKLFVPPPGVNDLSGQTLGNYKLLRKVAAGGMGVIYEAIQINLDRKVALKVLTEQLAGRPEFLQRFEREAKAAAALSHSNVVQVHDFGIANGRHFIVMEFIDGENLSEYVSKRGKIPVENALAIIEQAALALKAAAEKSIIHRDIKPSNLMVTRDGRVKVADMGLAKILSQDSELTMSSVSIGSPHFIAPEQAGNSKNADHRVDIYSLGVTLLFLVTGKHAYDGDSPISVVLAHATKPLPSGAELGTELPAEIEALIRRMAAKNPDERHQTYDELLADLQLVKQGYLPMLAAPPQEFISTKSPKKFAAAIAIGAIVLLAIIAGAFLINKSHEQKTTATIPNPAQASIALTAPPENKIPQQQPLPPPENNFQQPPQRPDNFQPPAQQGNDARPLMLVIGALDANHDRVIDSGEIANASAELKSLDKNGDGKLEANEYLTAMDLSNGIYKQFRIYNALHPDASGTIGSNEIANAPAELKQLDLNGDGQLDAQEFGPAGGRPPIANGFPPNGPPQNGPPNGVRPNGRPPRPQ